MAARREPAATPLHLRLTIPGAEAFRAVAATLAGKFAQAAGIEAGDAERAGQQTEAAARRAAERAGGVERAILDVEFVQTGPRSVEIQIQTDHDTREVVRVSSR